MRRSFLPVAPLLLTLFAGTGVYAGLPSCSDVDADGVCDQTDNCPITANPAQQDVDGDGIGDACDSCITDPANRCDSCTCPPDADCWPCPQDWDCDGVADEADNCPCHYNPAQVDVDVDSVGDVCDECTDTDGDGFGNPGYPPSLCPPDNCPHHYNPWQQDSDADGLGDACDNCRAEDSSCDESCPAEHSCYQDADCDPGEACLPSCFPSYCFCEQGSWVCTDDCAGICVPQNCQDPSGSDSDTDGVSDSCDNCPLTFNPEQEDWDADGVGDACDNCPAAFNPTQSDADSDGLGDVCDPASGVIQIRFGPEDLVTWGAIEPFESWNLYRGDLSQLWSSGEYTQAPGSNWAAMRICGYSLTWFKDSEQPTQGDVAFYLVTGMASDLESPLGVRGNGELRPNTLPCRRVSAEAQCVATGGRWDVGSCGHYPCGEFPDCDAVIPGCDCGAGRNFVDGTGCQDDPTCA